MRCEAVQGAVDRVDRESQLLGPGPAHRIDSLVHLHSNKQTMQPRRAQQIENELHLGSRKQHQESSVDSSSEEKTDLSP